MLWCISSLPGSSPDLASRTWSAPNAYKREVAKVQTMQRYILNDHRRRMAFKRQQENKGRAIRMRVSVFASIYVRHAFEKICDRYNPVNEGSSIRERNHPARPNRMPDVRIFLPAAFKDLA